MNHVTHMNEALRTEKDTDTNTNSDTDTDTHTCPSGPLQHMYMSHVTRVNESRRKMNESRHIYE